MEDYELLSFTEDGILAAVSCHFGSQSPDTQGTADHTEAELREVYDTLYRAASGIHGEPVQKDDTAPGISSALWLEAPYELDIVCCFNEEKGLFDAYVSAVDREALVKMLTEHTSDRQ